MSKVREMTRMTCFLWSLLLFLGCFLWIAPQGAEGQTPAARRVTIKVSNESADEVLSQIRRQAGLNYIMQGNTSGHRVTVNAENATVTAVLNEVCRQLDCQYTIKNGYITITPKPQSPLPTAPKGQRMLHGIVLDKDNEPLIGAIIKVGDGKIGTVTNAMGEFHFAIPTSSFTLHVSYVGMADKDVHVKAGNESPVLNIKMESNTNIDEVVVTGYANIDRRKLTSSVTSLKAEDIMRPGINSIDQMLEGQVPDLMFTSNSGEVGSVPRLRIRGTSTLIGNREPLWVLDGIVLQDPVNVSPEELNNPDYVNRIGNAISGINPQDIERIDVLKDASATALYGAKAANGVIVITTKKGHVGKPIISYSGNVSYKMRPSYTDRKIDLVNSKERIDFSRYLVENGYQFGTSSALVGYENLARLFYNGSINHDEFAKQVQYLEGLNTDWFDFLTTNAVSNTHSVSISGGSENALLLR